MTNSEFSLPAATTSMYTKDRLNLIAPCGLDCRLCQRYQRDINPCPGCRGADSQKLQSCLQCKIKNCRLIKLGKITFCCECPDFPCDLITKLAKRDSNSYGIHIMNNLYLINRNGVKNFVRKQEKTWRCSRCNQIICMHKAQCLHCGKARR